MKSATSTCRQTRETQFGRTRTDLEQTDHRGKRFTIEDDDVDDDRFSVRRRRVVALEQQAQRERRELERAKAVAGSAGANPDVEVLDR
ncbi:hypothetical protein [Natronosalvus rutilus]|uniref:Uncharacterized protein n=1 Tax=Natronosalvus rutilus TaxID=2953753 RepID=A0A9E7SX52_9EURY|nr:hypothetical protein [Natronosalvus rutilus]UTF55827.1 hypothetical protein NGM29_19345 [Natronosalvus rutilus]